MHVVFINKYDQGKTGSQIDRIQERQKIANTCIFIFSASSTQLYFLYRVIQTRCPSFFSENKSSDLFGFCIIKAPVKNLILTVWKTEKFEKRKNLWITSLFSYGKGEGIGMLFGSSFKKKQRL